MAHVAVLHCLLEDSNLLGYERELLEQGADDVYQLQELGEDDFKQLCVAVGMAGKPLHMMRFRRALQRHYHHSNLATPSPPSHTTKPSLSPPPHPASIDCLFTAGPLPTITSSPTVFKAIQGTSGLSGQLPQVQPTVSHLRTCKREPHDEMDSMPFWSLQRHGDQTENCIQYPPGQPQSGYPTETPPTSSCCHGNASREGTWWSFQRSEVATPTSPSPNAEWIRFEELVDELTPTQNQLGPPPLSPSVWDRKRAELIRKSSTIYGGHTAKRRHLPLTAHEESVNEAAFQLCLRDPTLLVRRDELFLLARRAIKKRGHACGHGDPKGRQCSSPSHKSFPPGQKRPRPDGDGSHGNIVDHSPRVDLSSHAHLVSTSALEGQVVPRPSDYTTLYTLPVWTEAAAAALRGGVPTSGPQDHSMSTARRLQSLDEQSCHAHPPDGRVSHDEGGSPSSLEECNSAYLTSQVPVLRDLSPPLHTSSHLSPPLHTSHISPPLNTSHLPPPLHTSSHRSPLHTSSSTSSSTSSLYHTSDARQLVEHVNRTANEAVQLLSSFTRVDMHRPHHM